MKTKRDLRMIGFWVAVGLGLFAFWWGIAMTGLAATR